MKLIARVISRFDMFTNLYYDCRKDWKFALRRYVEWIWHDTKRYTQYEKPMNVTRFRGMWIIFNMDYEEYESPLQMSMTTSNNMLSSFLVNEMNGTKLPYAFRDWDMKK